MPLPATSMRTKRGDLDVLADLGHRARRARPRGRRWDCAGQLAGDVVAERAKVVVARDEIGLAIDFDQDARAGAGLDALHDDAFVGLARRLLGRGCRALLRRLSTAASMSPLASVSAFLQSIRPAPVISRSLPTTAAVISAIMRIVTSLGLDQVGTRLGSAGSRSVRALRGRPGCRNRGGGGGGRGSAVAAGAALRLRLAAAQYLASYSAWACVMI